MPATRDNALLAASVLAPTAGALQARACAPLLYLSEQHPVAQGLAQRLGHGFGCTGGLCAWHCTWQGVCGLQFIAAWPLGSFAMLEAAQCAWGCRARQCVTSGARGVCCLHGMQRLAGPFRAGRRGLHPAGAGSSAATFMTQRLDSPRPFTALVALPLAEHPPPAMSVIVGPFFVTPPAGCSTWVGPAAALRGGLARVPGRGPGAHTHSYDWPHHICTSPPRGSERAPALRARWMNPFAFAVAFCPLLLPACWPCTAAHPAFLVAAWRAWCPILPCSLSANLPPRLHREQARRLPTALACAGPHSTPT